MVPLANVIGKAVFVYWPLANLGLVAHPIPIPAQ
jgi:hypothetical protein